MTAPTRLAALLLALLALAPAGAQPADGVSDLAARPGAPGATVQAGGPRGGPFAWSAEACRGDGVLAVAAPAGCWRRVWDGRTARPEWAGAVADDDRDDTAAIQAALDAAPRVELGAGTYLVGTLRLADGAELAGVGPASVLRLRPGLDPDRRVDYGGASALTMVVPARDGVAFALRRLTLDHDWPAYGERYDSPTVSVQNTRGAVIEGCTFVRANTMAVWADSRDGDETRGVRFVGNRLASSRGGGFSVFGRVVGAVVAQNVFENGEDDAVAFQDAPNVSAPGFSFPEDATVTGNVVRGFTRRNTSGSTAHGILIFGTVGARVERNTIDGTVSSGVMVTRGHGTRSARVTVADNVSARSGAETTGRGTAGVPVAGYIVLDSDDVTLTGNRTDGSAGSGVSIRGSARVRVEGGAHADLGGAGVRIEDSEGVAVQGVEVRNPGGLTSERAGVLAIATTRDVQATLTDVRVVSTDGRMQYGVQTARAPGHAVDVRLSGGRLAGWTVEAAMVPPSRMAGVATE